MLKLYHGRTSVWSKRSKAEALRRAQQMPHPMGAALSTGPPAYQTAVLHSIRVQSTTFCAFSPCFFARNGSFFKKNRAAIGHETALTW
jgi:hypothetical protein